VAAGFGVDFADGVAVVPAVLAVKLGALAGVGGEDALDAGVGVPGLLGFAAAGGELADGESILVAAGNLGGVGQCEGGELTLAVAVAVAVAVDAAVGVGD
jgi:hypothetical protein